MSPWSNRELRKFLSKVMLCPTNRVSCNIFLSMKLFIWSQAVVGGIAIWLCCIRSILFTDIAPLDAL